MSLYYCPGQINSRFFDFRDNIHFPMDRYGNTCIFARNPYNTYVYFSEGPYENYCFRENRKIDY